SLINYVLRNNLSYALPSMREEFEFSSAELGWILAAFNYSYALFQIPAGVVGDVYGPRRVLAIAAVGWALMTALTGFAPDLLAASATGVMVSLMVVRFGMGILQAPMFPVSGGSLATWFPVGAWGLPNAMLSAGLAIGQALTGPLVAFLIIKFGWRESFYYLAPTALLVGWWWWHYGRDQPSEHPAITAAELEVIAANRDQLQTNLRPHSWREVLRERDVVLLAGAYFCMNYVFIIFVQWLFTYLVEARHFSILESGLLSFLPFTVGAVLAGVGGVVCDWACRRFGPRWGCRLAPLIGLSLVAILLIAGLYVQSPYLAVGLLSLCFGFTQFTEGSYWAASTYAAGPHTATATGLMNTGGNLPGLLAPLFGFMIDRFGWETTISSGSLFAILGAVLWLMVRLQPATDEFNARLQARAHE
ncbi:MFS transporter, partial [Steroidobacter sp.]|uniref:MFS transporter n=1 Tax=Steroidobacter sp. TaxID=1978227 RepID=UPI001A44ADD0